MTEMQCAALSTPSSAGLSGIQYSKTPTYDDPERPESIDIHVCTKDEVRGDFLRPPHNNLKSAI